MEGGWVGVLLFPSFFSFVFSSFFTMLTQSVHTLVLPLLLSKKVKLHTTSISGFLLGGVAGRFGYKHYNEMALIFNVSILFMLGVLHTREWPRMHI